MTTVQCAFDRAIATFTHHLTAEECRRIKLPTSLPNLVSRAQDMADGLGGSRKKHSTDLSLGEKAIQLESFERLVEGLCKASPVMGDLIWSSVSFILHMTKSNLKVFEEVMGFFETMADDIGYIRLQENTFEHSTVVQSAVEALYGAMLKFWVEAVKYYRSKQSGFRARVKLFLQSPSMDTKFQTLREEIKEQKTRIHEASSAQHNADSAKVHGESKLRERNDNHRRLRDWVSALDYEADFHAALDRHYEGTCQWIQKKPAFAEWASSTANVWLFIHGIPGAGKTILCSWFINDALHHTADNNLVLYHFFKDTDPNRQTHVSAIRSFIDQLFNHLRGTQNPVLEQLESMLDAASLQHRHVNISNLWEIFSRAVSLFIESTASGTARPIIIVMDAMDESDSAEKIITSILKLAHQNQGRVKVLATGRRSAWDLINSSLSTFPLRPLELEISPEDVQNDISNFVRSTISGVPRLNNYERLRDRLCAEIGKVDNHQGMFLWAYFVCEEVKRQGDVRALQKLVDDLPRGLDAMYIRICKAITETDEGSGFSLSVLQWIVNSPRPLRFSELQEGLRLMRAQRDDEPSSVPDQWFDGAADLIWSRQDIVYACGNLVTYSGVDQDDSFRLVHLSATQFFRKASPIEFIENIRGASSTLGLLCLDYLLSEKLHSDKLFASSPHSNPIVEPISFSSPYNGDFMLRHPLFNFSVNYWPDFTLHYLRASASSAIAVNRGFVEKAVSFVSDPFVNVWLEYFIRQFDVEITVYIIRRFLEVHTKDQPELAVFMDWAHKTVTLLGDFASTLSHRPHLIRKCCPTSSVANDNRLRTWQHVHSTTETASTTLKIPAASNSTAWIHYLSDKDVLLSIDRDANPRSLRSQVLSTGMPLRHAQASPVFDMPFQSAVVSPSGRMIAAAVHNDDYSEIGYVCWRLPTRGASIWGPEAEPQLILCESTADKSGIWDYRPFGRTEMPILAFRGDDALVTPRGIWDVKTTEWLAGPAAIYKPSLDFGVKQTSFSGNGERAARVNTTFGNIEVLNTRDGSTVCKASFPHTPPNSLLRLQAFSQSGQKIIVFHCFSDPSFSRSLLCFLVNINRTIKLEIPQLRDSDGPDNLSIAFSQFTSEEDVFLASILVPTQDNSGFTRSIAMWKFTKDPDGNYCYHAALSHLFKSVGAQPVFCVVPSQSPHSDSPDAIIATGPRSFTRRSINTLWSPDSGEPILPYGPRIRRLEVLPKKNAFNIKTFSKARYFISQIDFFLVANIHAQIVIVYQRRGNYCFS
ncbi:hypothetical protein C0991_008676 [Blastosporella zonata]|nr:hypothetical protein C0991_008676 [Blastosporella zonata]